MHLKLIVVNFFIDFCRQPVTRTVSCKVRNGPEAFTKMVPRPCNRRWPNNNEVNCGMEAYVVFENLLSMRLYYNFKFARRIK